MTAVRPYGKAMVTYFDNGLGVYSHNQLYGIWVVCKPNAAPATRRQLRFAVHTPSRWALLYSASDIQVLPAQAVPAHPYIAKLGPDTLDAAITPQAVAERTGVSVEAVRKRLQRAREALGDCLGRHLERA